MKLAGKLGQKLSYKAYYHRVQQLAQQPKVRVSGLVSLTLFTVAFFGMFAILPTFKTITKLKKEIKESEEVQVKLQNKIAAMDQAQKFYLQATNDIEIVEKILPDRVKFERLAWQIQWVAKNNQVDISSGGFGEFPVKNLDREKQKELQAVEIDMVLAGSYVNIRAFLQDLAKIDRLIGFDQVSISSKSVQKQSGIINANIKAQAYYLPEL